MNIADVLIIQKEFAELSCFSDERRIRLRRAARSRAYNRKNGRGGVTVVRRATGVSRRGICQGLKDIAAPEASDKGRIGKSGGGRGKRVELRPDILKSLDNFVDPDSRGDPESPLRRTLKSTYKLAAESDRQGYEVSHGKVEKLLADLGYR